jgi:hypothetical protein
MRRVFVVLLCLGLSFPSWAGWLASASCCPSQADVKAQIRADIAQQLIDAADTGEAVPECCNDLAAYLQSGQACKGSQAASAPLLGWPASGGTFAACPTLQAAASPAALSPPSADPEGIWRPPL